MAHARLSGIGNHQMIGRPEYPAMTDNTKVRAAHRTFNWFVENDPGSLPRNVVEQIQRESKTAGTGGNAKLSTTTPTPKINVQALEIPKLIPEIQKRFGRARWEHVVAILRETATQDMEGNGWGQRRGNPQILDL